MKLSGESESADTKAAEKFLEILDKPTIEKKYLLVSIRCPYRWMFFQVQISRIGSFHPY